MTRLGILVVYSAALADAQGFRTKGFDTKSIPVAGRIQSVTIADLNNDSLPDIAVRTADEVTVLLKAGGDDFSTASTALPYGPAAAAATDHRTGRAEIAADFNHDGSLDLVIRDRNEILFGRGDGTFLAPQPLAADAPAVYGLTATGDFDGDGNADLLFFVRGSFAILLGKRDGTFRFGSTAELGGDGHLVVADLNADGRSDLVYLHSEAGTRFYKAGCCEVRVYLGQPDGALQHHVEIPGVWPGSVLVADFNRDGVPDIAAPNAILFGRGDASFEAGPQFWFADADWHESPSGPAAAADLDGDGQKDLVRFDTIEGKSSVGIRGNGDGTFASPPYTWLFHLWEAIDRRVGGIADLDGDGRPDVVTAVYCRLAWESQPWHLSQGCSDRSDAITVFLNRIE